MDYSFIIRLQDLVSPAMQRLSSQFGSTISRMDGLTTRLQSGFNRVSQSVGQLRDRLMGLGSAGRSIDTLNTKLDALTKQRNLSFDTREIRRLNREIDQTEAHIRRMQNMGRGGGLLGMFGGGGGASGGLMGMAAGYLAPAALLMGGGALVKSGVDREQTKVAFEQFVGKQGVDPLMVQMNKFADVTPYSNEDVYGAARKLLSAGLTQQQLTPAMTNVGNMAAVSQKDFGDLTAAYAKIKQKGFVDGGELHEEFGGTAVMDQLKKNLGVNGEQLFKMAEKHQISFPDLDKAIADLSKKGGIYEGGLDKLSKTVGGKWSTLMGTLGNKATTLMESLNPLFGMLIDIGNGILEALSPVFDAITNLFSALSPLFSAFTSLLGLFGLTGGHAGVLTILLQGLAMAINGVAWVVQQLTTFIQYLVDNPLLGMIVAIGLLIINIGTVVGWLGVLGGWLLRAALWVFNLVRGILTLNMAMLANPAVWLSLAFIALVAGIVYAWEHVDGFRHAIIRCWETIKSMFSAVGPILKALIMPTPANIAAAFEAVKKGWSDGMKNGDAAVASDKASRAAAKAAAAAAKAQGKPKPGEMPAMPGAGAGAGAGGKKDGDGVQATVSGARSTSITLNLKSLVEHLTINANGVRESAHDMEAQLTDHLLRVLNSANAMDTQN